MSIKIIKILSIVAYGFIILASATLLFLDPIGLDVRRLILPIVALLFVSALGFSYGITSKNPNKTVVWLGTVLVAVVFAAFAFFAIAAIAWFIIVSRV